MSPGAPPGRRPRRWRWRWLLWGLATVVVVASLVSAWSRRQAQINSPLAQAERVRDQVRAAQTEARTCLERLSVSETRFQSQTRETEALQARIRGLEGLHPEGVPSDSYDVYLETVERFNAAVEGWDVRGDALENRQRACRELVETRNILSDSLRGMLEDMGYLPDPGSP